MTNRPRLPLLNLGTHIWESFFPLPSCCILALLLFPPIHSVLHFMYRVPHPTKCSNNLDTFCSFRLGKPAVASLATDLSWAAGKVALAAIFVTSPSFLGRRLLD